jgi:hypothetical protein
MALRVIDDGDQESRVFRVLQVSPPRPLSGFTRGEEGRLLPGAGEAAVD